MPLLFLQIPGKDGYYIQDGFATWDSPTTGKLDSEEPGSHLSLAWALCSPHTFCTQEPCFLHPGFLHVLVYRPYFPIPPQSAASVWICLSQCLAGFQTVSFRTYISSTDTWTPAEGAGRGQSVQVHLSTFTPEPHHSTMRSSIAKTVLSQDREGQKEARVLHECILCITLLRSA